MSEPIRVAQVLNRMDNGGIEAVVLNYYRCIDRSKVQFDFYFAEGSTLPQRAELQALGAGLYPIPPYGRPLAYHRALYRAFKARGYAIVHAHLSTMSVFALFAAWHAGVPVRICHNHSTAHWGEGVKTLLKYILRPFNKLFATDWFACGEQSGRWMYGDRAFNAGRVTVMVNAIDTARFAYDPAARQRLRAKLGIAPDAFVVGHVGRFLYQKNHKFLVNVFAEVVKQRPDARLLLVGEGELKAAVRQQVNQMGLADRVVFTGPRQDVAKLYSAMDVFCLPSNFEGMPLVAWEAQANGLPCVLSQNVTPEAVLADNVHRLKLEQPAKEWADSLLRSARGPAAAVPDIGAVAEKLTEIYRSGAALQQRSPMQPEPIRVAQVLNRMDSGGIEAVILNYYRHIDRSKVQFDFYFAKDSTLPRRAELQALGAGLYPIPSYGRPFAYHWTLYRAFKTRGYVIVHAHLSTMSVFTLFAAWHAGVPVRICHNHSTAHWGEGVKTLLKYILRPFNKLFATDWFACGERAGRWMYGDKAFNAGRVTVMPNAIDTVRFAFDPAIRQRLRAELGIAPDAFVVGHVGRFTYAKNHKYLLEIFSEVQKQRPDARLLLVGEGELMAAVRRRVNQMDLADRVIFTGPRQDVAELYSAMDVFCLPSNFEGMPLVVWEAQANGLPCVVSQNVTQEAVLADNVCLLKLEQPAKEWADSLLRPARGPAAAVPDIGAETKRFAGFYLKKQEAAG